jgi:hypothetical protein
MKKNLFALLLLVGVVFASCKKDTPAVTDARDKFVGTWNGTSNTYEAGALISTDPTTYTITKDANNSNKILISTGGVSVPATVNGSSYTISNLTLSDGSFSYLINGNGTLNGNSITENGTDQETDLSTGDIVNYTYTTTVSK